VRAGPLFFPEILPGFFLAGLSVRRFRVKIILIYGVAALKISEREVFPTILFAGLKRHIFVSVPLVLYLLASIDGRIVFYVLLLSFQLFICTLIGLALFAHEEVTSLLVICLLRLFSVFCWGGLCFMLYALIGSVVYTKLQQIRPPRNNAAVVYTAGASPALGGGVPRCP